MPKPKEESWEKKFNEYFENIRWDSRKGTQSITDFIRQLLQETHTSAIKECIEEVENIDITGFVESSDHLDDLITRLKRKIRKGF